MNLICVFTRVPTRSSPQISNPFLQTMCLGNMLLAPGGRKVSWRQVNTQQDGLVRALNFINIAVMHWLHPNSQPH